MASRFTDAPDNRPTYAETVADLVTVPALRASSSVGKIALVLGLLAILGVVAFVMKAITDGFDNRADWGYYVAIVSFMLSTTAGAPMVSIAPPLAKANWIRPVMRVAQMFSVAGIMTAIMSIPLIFMLPPLVEDGIRRRSIWFGSPIYYPHIWTTIAIVGLIGIGLALLWANSIPDLAAIRESGTGRRQKWARRLAPGFVGSTTQWNALKMRIGMLSAFYFLFLIFTHVLFASDYIHSMVAGWKDAIFPMYHALTSLQAGVASVIVASYFVRRWGGLDRYLGLEQIWSLAKLQLALSLLWFYFFFSAFIIFWYGRTPFNANLIELLTHGPYLWAFLGALFFSFIIPMWTLMWNFIRVSIRGPVIIAIFILSGTLLDRVRLAVGAWSTEGLNDKFLQEVPATVWPDGWDLLIFVGAFSGAALLFLGITRFIPAISLWEVSNARLLTKPGKYMRSHIQIVGKPD